MGNQPQSTSSNRNVRSSASSKVPARKPRKVKFRRQKKAGLSGQKMYDNKQTNAINKLQRQVYGLQMAKYGKTQQNFHQLTNMLGIPGKELTPDHPHCFDLTDFTCQRGPIIGGRVYRYDGGVTEVANWERNAATLDNYYWENQNEDQPDGGAYLAMDATYYVEVKGGRALNNCRIRFDVISQKDSAVIPSAATVGAVENLILPDTLGYLKSLAQPHLNRINPSFFKKYFTKVVFINSSKTIQATKGTTANVMRFSFTIRPKKLCVQNETNPQVGGGAIVDETTQIIGEQAEYERGNFGPLNTPSTQPLWMVISSDDGAIDNENVNISISRRIRWKDALGSSAV